VGDEDCPDGYQCGPVNSCFEPKLCDSDKDCKEYDLVCDLEAGQCVDCVGSADCEADHFCLDTQCVPDKCDAGVLFCDGNQILLCPEDGGNGELQAECESSQYCEAGECHDQTCPPGQSWCDGNVAKACDDMGKEVISEDDCDPKGQCCLAGECEDPPEEVCDGVDNNCNGEIDEGVLSPCGDCNPDCQDTSTGPGCENPFLPEETNSYGLELDAEGNLVIALEQPDPPYIWVSNSSANTVSKMDVATGAEAGRYAVCSNPSRTAVDLHSNVYVACRSDGGVVKVAGDQAFCADKNGNGEIDTATDTNGDGSITGNEILPKGQDECVIFTVYPGGSCQRAMGVDAQNFAWVGEWNSKKLRRLTSESGATVQELSLPANPYGLVIDSEGTIWVSGRGGSLLVRVDPATEAIQSFASNIGCFQP